MYRDWMQNIAIGAALLVMTAFAGACGGEGTGPGAASSTPPATSSRSPLPAANDQGTVDVSGRGSSVDLTIETVTRAFKPTFVKVAPGQTLRLTLANPSNALHTFTITALQINEQLHTASPPTTITIAVPASGHLAFFCRLHGSLGMWGAFTSGSATAEPPTPY